jgi:hypothetical protein
MSDPKRLLDEGTDPLALEILRAGEADTPSAAGRELTLLALGLSGAALTGTAVTASRVGLLARVPLAAKSILVLAITGGGLGVGVHYASAPPASRVRGVSSGPAPLVASAVPLDPVAAAPGAPLSPGVPAPADPAREPPATTRETVGLPASTPAAETARGPGGAVAAGPTAAGGATMTAKNSTSLAASSLAATPAHEGSAPRRSPDDGPRPDGSAPVAARSSAGASPPVSQAISLNDEIKMIDGIRASLAAHDAQGALRQLDAYQIAAPRGSLTAQATLLRVEALLARGDRAAATSLGRSFVAGHPQSPVANRIRTLVGDGSDR